MTTIDEFYKVGPGPSSSHKPALDEAYQSDRGIGVIAAYALAGSEENARGHLVVTAPTGGSAGVLPAPVYGLGEGERKLPPEKIRQSMLAAAAIGYLCKHNATLAPPRVVARRRLVWRRRWPRH